MQKNIHNLNQTKHTNTEPEPQNSVM